MKYKIFMSLISLSFGLSLTMFPVFAQNQGQSANPIPYSGLTAEEPKRSPKPTPRLPNGKPDLSGYWKGSRATKPVGNIGKDLPGFKLPLTEEGKKQLEYNLTKSVDPESLCNLGGNPRHSASGLPFMIQQTNNLTTFLYFYTYHRLIPTDGRKHSEDPDPTYFGEAIGWWEGDTLVIDAIGYKGTQVWIDENANPHSEALHTVEKWSRPDYDHLVHEVTITDPKHYTKPFKYTRTWLIGEPGQILKEYACAENAVHRDDLGFGPGPIRPDGSRGYLNPAPLPPPPTAADFEDDPPAKATQKK